jgi:hypothetical protein
MTPTPLPFDGITYKPRDSIKFGTQLWGVLEVMSDGNWRTIPDLDKKLRLIGIYATHQGISARIRDLRKAKFGGRKIERREIRPRLYEYRLLPEEAMF